MWYYLAMCHQQHLPQHEHRLDLVPLLLHVVLKLRDALSQLQGLMMTMRQEGVGRVGGEGTRGKRARIDTEPGIMQRQQTLAKGARARGSDNRQPRTRAASPASALDWVSWSAAICWARDARSLSTCA